MLEITVGHWQFLDQFQQLVIQNPPNLLHVLNGMAITSLQNLLFSKNGGPISNPYYYQYNYIGYLINTAHTHSAHVKISTQCNTVHLSQVTLVLV